MKKIIIFIIGICVLGCDPNADYSTREVKAETSINTTIICYEGLEFLFYKSGYGGGLAQVMEYNPTYNMVISRKCNNYK